MRGFKGTIRPDADGRLTIVDAPSTRILATASLTNRSTLPSKLKCDGALDDDGLLVAAWDAWGEEMIDHLQGRYAFVVLDEDRRRAFAVVDRLASIPLHYHAADGVLTVSTSLKELADDPSIRGGINRRMVADYLLSTGDGPALGNQTFFEGINRLPAGHALTFDSGRPAIRRYHRPERREEALEDDEAVARFRELLKDAVSTAGETGRVAVSLSGGLDSSAVAAVARDLWESVPAIHFHSDLDDETSWLEPVVADGGLTVETVGCDGFMATADVMLEALAEPWPYDNFHHEYLMLKRAGEMGCATLIGGYYGDVAICESLDYLKPLADAGKWRELHEACVVAAAVQKRPVASFLAYVAGDRFDTLARSRKWRALWSDLRTVSDVFGIPFRGLFWHFFLRPLTPVPFRRLYRIVRGIERPVWWEMNRQLNPTFATAMELNKRAKRMKAAWTTPLKDARTTHENLIYHDSTALTLAQLHALSEATGVTAAHPFMDDALIDFCLALPRNLHGRDGWDRWITREAMTGRLPDAVRCRTERTNYAATSLAELRHDAAAIDAFVDAWPSALYEFIDREAFVRDWQWIKEDTYLSPALAAAGRRIRRTVLLGKWLIAHG